MPTEKVQLTIGRTDKKKPTEILKQATRAMLDYGRAVSELNKILKDFHKAAMSMDQKHLPDD